MDRIVEETGCSRQEARKLVNWLRTMLRIARKGDGLVCPREWQLKATGYKLFARIVPPDAEPEKDNAHARLNRLLLRDKESSIKHVLLRPYDYTRSAVQIQNYQPYD
jgi:hypothetical protein